MLPDGPREARECVVCFNETADAIEPCGHVVCHTCATRWLQRRATCPVCRAVVARAPQPARDGHVAIATEAHGHVGVRLSDALAGVRVVSVDRRDLAYAAGLRAGDVLTHINGIRVSEHAVAIAIVECARANRIALRLTLLPRRSRWWAVPVRLATSLWAR